MNEEIKKNLSIVNELIEGLYNYNKKNIIEVKIISQYIDSLQDALFYLERAAEEENGRTIIVKESIEVIDDAKK